ncbi:MAG: hypothetical protein ABSH41_28445 [Syntrophobacteraceae bacterium]
MLGTILIIVLLVMFFGGGGGYYWSRRGRFWALRSWPVVNRQDEDLARYTNW